MTGALRVLLSGVADVVPEDDLAERLGRARPLRVKLGLDPTAADVTLGWAVVLRKLRQFQDLGHTAVLIVGDFTARVGDPSGKSEARPRLDKEAVQSYTDRLLGQFWKILDRQRTEVRYNSEWLEALGMEGILRLTASYTVARMLERDDFATRYREGRPISIMEFLYPLLQGYDSVAVEADVELGGSDQRFNLLVGRELQRDWGQEPQIAMTMPLLEGIDGVQKMSQSLGNYVGVEEPADDMFGKLMRIPDGLVAKYLRMCTDVAPDEVDRVEAELAAGVVRPDVAKRRMAREVVDLYHGAGEGGAAEARFNSVHRDREMPESIRDVAIRRSEVLEEEKPGVVKLKIASLLVESGLAGTKSEARRLLAQNGVRRNGEVVTQEEEGTIDPESILGSVWQVGRRRFARVARLV